MRCEADRKEAELPFASDSKASSYSSSASPCRPEGDNPSRNPLLGVRGQTARGHADSNNQESAEETWCVEEQDNYNGFVRTAVVKKLDQVSLASCLCWLLR